MIKLTINNKEVEAREGQTVLEAAKTAGIEIPTLCYLEGVPPYGGCRLCVVEVSSGGRTRVVVSCLYPVEKGLQVVTDSDEILKIRKIIIELLLARCPNSEPIQKLAASFGLKEPRFPKRDDNCILCGLCVRVCNEVMGRGAIGFVGRGIERKVKAPFDGRSPVCMACGACLQVCPTGTIRPEDVSTEEVRPILSEYDMNLKGRPSIYISYPQAVPKKAVIDPTTCVGLNTGKCKVCAEVCEAKAIDFEQREEKIDLDVGSIILASGFELIDPKIKGEYGYSYYPNVLTSLEFERYLSASGPTGGHVIRPSDHAEPKKVAWIQCVGSRDIDRPYCSSVCCMYATKEAIIAKEHSPELEPTVFFMDLRAFGKGFDKYYQRAEKEYGVRYIRSQVSKVYETPSSRNLQIRYLEDGNLREEEFDLVVLSMGLKTKEKIRQLADILGVERNTYDFIQSQAFSSVTLKEGIYACGAVEEPKDIPETVMQASAAAACAEELLQDVRGQLIEHKEYPPERDISGQEPRIGVFVCRCGINIAATVDVPDVVKYAGTLPNVVVSQEAIYACSSDNQARIREAVIKHKLNRVVVAACTPRTHEPLFQDTIREAGLNPYLFEMANIRDQCSWVHQSIPAKATAKAKDLVRMAVAGSSHLQPLHLLQAEITRVGLVIGGGVSGMRAALSLAAQGFKVHLIEKEAELGGNLRRVYFTLNGNDPQAYLQSQIEQVRNHQLIEMHLSSELEETTGHVGHFTSEVRNQKSEVRRIEHGVLIVATGGTEYKPTEYLYGQDKRVITQLELEERLANPHSAFRNPHSVVMIGCVGSRDEERPYCSRLCCAQAIKNALKIKEKHPEADVYYLYRDIRTYGFKEQYYQAAREAGVIFIRYDEGHKPEVIAGDRLRVKVRDPILGEDLTLEPDLVVLNAAVVAQPDAGKISQALKVTLGSDGFFLEAHLKLRPVDFAT
ncbi:MAG: FAD-dependent oxidoreductase, partial [bacterium]|nr:FAD-dependent oxidoreductase [bacterium]